MKDNKQFWESDIRRKVTEHEFDYDPMAWDDMSSLLDETVIPNKSTQSGQVSDINPATYWKPFLFIVFVLGAIAFIYFSKKDELPTVNPTSNIESQEKVPSLTNTTVASTKTTIIPDKEIRNTASAEEIITAPSRKTIDDTEIDQMNKAEEIPEIISATSNEDDQIDQALLNERSQFKVVEFLPSTTTIQLLEIPEPSIDLELQSTKGLKRKRDRKKLYPDVIENY